MQPIYTGSPVELFELLGSEEELQAGKRFLVAFDFHITINTDSGLETYLESFDLEIEYAGCTYPGDVNCDATWNVLDIVTLATCILNNNCPNLECGCAADLNGDGNYNVLDVVILANCILSVNCHDLG